MDRTPLMVVPLVFAFFMSCSEDTATAPPELEPLEEALELLGRDLLPQGLRSFGHRGLLLSGVS